MGRRVQQRVDHSIGIVAGSSRAVETVNNDLAEVKEMENEKTIENLETELIQMKDNFNEMKADRDKLNRELAEARYSLSKAESMNERLLRVIENLSSK